MLRAGSAGPPSAALWEIQLTITVVRDEARSRCRNKDSMLENILGFCWSLQHTLSYTTVSCLHNLFIVFFLNTRRLKHALNENTAIFLDIMACEFVISRRVTIRYEDIAIMS